MALEQQGAKCRHGIPRKRCKVVKHREDGHEAEVIGLNFHGVGEFIALFNDGSQDSCMMSEYEPTCSSWKKIDALYIP